MTRGRTLRRYIARSFLLTIFGTFLLCSILIFMIDFVEMLRQSGKSGNVGVGTLVWLTVLRLPAYTEILMSFAVLVGSIGALLMLSRKSELAVMRSAGMSVWEFLRPGTLRRCRGAERHDQREEGATCDRAHSASFPEFSECSSAGRNREVAGQKGAIYRWIESWQPAFRQQLGTPLGRVRAPPDG